jgi:aspartate carbamoyltransferase regulatory subunit
MNNTMALSRPKANNHIINDYEIWRQIVEELPTTSRKILGYLGRFFFSKQPIFPSIEKISAETNIPFGTVENHLGRIKGLGVLKVLERCWNSSNVYGFHEVFNKKSFKSLIWSCVREYRDFKEKSAVLTVKLRLNINNKINNIRKEIPSTYAEAWDFIFNKGERRQKRERNKLAMDKIEQDRLEKIKTDKAWYHARENGIVYSDHKGISQQAYHQAWQMFADEDAARERLEIEEKYRRLDKLQAIRQAEARKRDEEAVAVFLLKPIDENFKINYYVERKSVGCV